MACFRGDNSPENCEKRRQLQAAVDLIREYAEECSINEQNYKCIGVYIHKTGVTPVYDYMVNNTLPQTIKLIVQEGDL